METSDLRCLRRPRPEDDPQEGSTPQQEDEGEGEGGDAGGRVIRVRSKRGAATQGGQEGGGGTAASGDGPPYPHPALDMLLQFSCHPLPPRP